MKPAHHLLAVLAAAVAAAGSARAAPHVCRGIAVPADATGELVRWNAELSLAACLEAAAPRPPPVGDPAELRPMVLALRWAVEPSIAIYRTAFEHGPWEVRLIAAYQLGQTYFGIVERARAAIALPPDLARDPEAADTFCALHHALEPMLVPYTRAAIAAFSQAKRLADELPEGVPADRVVRAVVAGTRAALETVETN